MDRDALILYKLDVLLLLTQRVLDRERILAMTLDDLKAKVEAENTVIGSAITLLGELKTMLDAAIASGDPTKVQAIADMIDSEQAALAAAVAANTPAAPTV